MRYGALQGFVMRGLGIAFALLAATAPACAATDVVFTGNVTDTCTLSIPTPGIMTLSADGLTLGSDQPLGLPATVTVLSLGSNTVTLAAPTLTAHPAGYTAGSETVEMSYSGLASHAYTSAQQTIPLAILSIVTLLVVNLHVINAAGFAQGAYTAKTVLTCS